MNNIRKENMKKVMKRKRRTKVEMKRDEMAEGKVGAELEAEVDKEVRVVEEVVENPQDRRPKENRSKYEVNEKVSTPDGDGLVISFMRVTSEGTVLGEDSDRTDYTTKVTVKLFNGANKVYSEGDLNEAKKAV